MKISKESIAIIESLAYKIHEVERQYYTMVTDPYERDEIKNVIDALKSRIGRFFMKNMDRRMIVRSDTSPLKDYGGYFGLEDDALKDQESVDRTCKFCGSQTTSTRRDSDTGYLYLYCSHCRQETCIPKLKDE